jgi:hypothetical protein
MLGAILLIAILVVIAIGETLLLPTSPALVNDLARARCAAAGQAQAQAVRPSAARLAGCVARASWPTAVVVDPRY